MAKANKIKILITGFILSMVPAFLYSQNLQEHRQTLVEYSEEPVDQIKYEDEIKEKEIPEGVVNSVKSSYPGHKIATAYRGSDGSFKISLITKNEKIAAFYSATGDFLKLEEDKEKNEENINDQWR